MTVILLFTSCGPGEQETISFNLDLGSALDEELLMSDFFESIRYIPLETNEECLIPYAEQIVMTPDYYLVNPRKGTVRAFNHEGKYVKDIGREGKGPGEYVTPSAVYFDIEEKQIIIHSMVGGQILHYSSEGEFLYDEHLKYPPQWLYRLSDGNYLGASLFPIEMDSIFTALNLISKEGHTQPLRFYSKDKTVLVPRIFIQPFYTSSSGIDLYIPARSDTLFMIENDTIFPYATLGLSSHIVPDEVYYDENSFERIGEFVTGLAPVVLGKNKLGIVIMKRQELSFGLLDTQANTSQVFRAENGIKNDIDGGINFPLDRAYKWVDGFARMAIPAAYLISALDDGDIEPDAELQKMIKGLNENDNPVLVECKLKNFN